MRGGLRVLDQFGQKESGGGNYKLNIQAEAGVNQVQKTDIFKIKHEINAVEDAHEGYAIAFSSAAVLTNGTGDFAGVAVGTVGSGSVMKMTFTIDGKEYEVTHTASAGGFTAVNAQAKIISMVNNDDDLKDLITAYQGSSTTTVNFRDEVGGNSFKFEWEDVSINGATSGSTKADPANQNIEALTGLESENFLIGDYRIQTTDYVSGGTTNVDASASIVGEYSQNEVDLVSAVTVSNTAQFNQSISFELTAKHASDSSMTFAYTYNSIKKDGSTETGSGFVNLTSGSNTSIALGNVTYLTLDLGAFADATVGDKFAINNTAQVAADGDKAITLEYNSNLTGDDWESVGKVVLTDGVLDHAGVGGTTDFKFQQLQDSTYSDDNGTLVQNEFTLEFGDITSSGATADFFTTTGEFAAAKFTNAISGNTIGKIATGGTRLYDSDKFWDASGNFILDEPQTITLVQGNGNTASFTISSADTFDDVAQKLNTAISEGLGQGAIVGEVNEERFVNYVEESEVMTSGLETVAGTFVIRSAVAGSEGEITFVGDDDTLNALSLTEIQEASNNNFTVDVTNAHTGEVVANDVKVSENRIIGVVHENVDVEFDGNTGIEVNWNSETNDFSLVGGGANSVDTFVHLADRTMVLHVGANQKQDIGMGIGDMGAESLGVDNIQVTSNELANDAIGTIDNAITRVSGERSKLGALQNRLDHTINNLGVTMENLTSAESRIRDADMAKEMMEFTKLQILSQSANAMLSQANQLPNNVLQLLR
jgi:flagellin